MRLKSYERFSKIMVDVQDKRDYVIANPNISEKNILKLVRLYDYILDEIERSYDLIIENNGINKNKINVIFENIISRITHIWEDKNGKDI